MIQFLNKVNVFDKNFTHDMMMIKWVSTTMVLDGISNPRNPERGVVR